MKRLAFSMCTSCGQHLYPRVERRSKEDEEDAKQALKGWSITPDIEGHNALTLISIMLFKSSAKTYLDCSFSRAGDIVGER